MMKTLLFTLFCATSLLLSCSTSEESDEGGITGLWKSRDQNSDKPRSLVAVYKYQDTYYGRMLATYDEDGNINDTILEQRGKAPGVVGNPPYCGMDFIYNLKKEDENNGKYRGRILDPERGHVYKAELWREGDILIVRGELWIFGKNIPWQKASKKDLPKGFSVKKIKDFVPVVPRTF